MLPGAHRREGNHSPAETVASENPGHQTIAIGIESVINFLAPDADDRFFQVDARKESLRFSGEFPGNIIRVEDGWQRIRVTLNAPGAQCFWIAPIETVSESEEGFERVYQGSQIMPIWHANLAEHHVRTVRLVWRVELI
jgi:hypothetical protein